MRAVTAVVVGTVLLAILVGAVAVFRRDGPVREGAEEGASGRCAPCHPGIHARWAQSGHARSIRPVTPALARAFGPPFDPPQAFRAGSRLTRFRREGDRLILETDAPGGGRVAYEVSHLAGARQNVDFLTLFPDGRLMDLPAAWHVERGEVFDYAAIKDRAEPIDDADPEAWFRPQSGLNDHCLTDCHASGFRKGYDAEAGRYDWTWRSPGVDCEACHGEAEDHVAFWSADPGDPLQDPIPRLERLPTARASEVCGRCHGLRRVLARGWRPGAPFVDHYVLDPLDRPDYGADGRVARFAYQFLPFLLSDCAEKGGAGCLTCHDPHAAERGAIRGGSERADEFCLRCHPHLAPDPAGHHRHVPGTPGGRCADCHMPRIPIHEGTYGIVDHHLSGSPNPVAAAFLGLRDPCLGCHADRDTVWAADRVRAWYGEEALAIDPLVEALGVALDRDPRAAPVLLEVLEDRGSNPWLRVSAAYLLGLLGAREARPALERALSEDDPHLRGYAAEALASLAGAGARGRLLRLLDDPSRFPRLAAASALSRIGTLREAPVLAPRILGEIEAFVATNPDVPDLRLLAGGLQAEAGQPAEALRHYRAAWRIRPEDPAVLEGLVTTLSDLGARAQTRGRTEEARGHYGEALGLASSDPEHRRALEAALDRLDGGR